MQVTGTGPASPRDHLDALGDLLRTRRENLGLSIRTAARSVGLSTVTWGKVENGQTVRPETVKRVGDALGLSGDLVVDAWRDRNRLPDLETAARQPANHVDLSLVSDADLLAELGNRLGARLTMLQGYLREQGNRNLAAS